MAKQLFQLKQRKQQQGNSVVDLGKGPEEPAWTEASRLQSLLAERHLLTSRPGSASDACYMWKVLINIKHGNYFFFNLFPA